jgi:hypothetical protein
MVGMQHAHHAFGLRAHEGVRDLPEDAANHDKRKVWSIGEPERHVQDISNDGQVLGCGASEMTGKLCTRGAGADNHRLERLNQIGGGARNSLFLRAVYCFSYLKGIVWARDNRPNSAAMGSH